MTRKEMTEIFSVMMIAWPNAEAFKGGIEKLRPTITLWTRSLAEVDYWTGQQAVKQMCKELKFPPTIADFRENVKAINKAVETTLEQAKYFVRVYTAHYGSLEAYYNRLPANAPIKQAIDLLGGCENMLITISTGDKVQRWNWEAFENAFKTQIRAKPEIGAKPNQPAIESGGTER